MHVLTIHFFQFYIQTLMISVVIGYLADLIVGDPHGMWHPIRLIGNIISGLERVIRKAMPKTDRGAFAGGILLVIFVLLCSAGIPLAVLLAAYAVRPWLCFVLQCYMCYAIFATKSLKTESMKVADALEKGGVEEGRRAVSMIVGRDTERLDETGVVKAAVETVAENTSDGIIAPMIFLVIGGPVLGFFYKGANTMDSMVGYKNEKYLCFGRAAARFDDFVNYLPSRISALFMILASCLLRRETVRGVPVMDGKRAAGIWKRDRRNHASPNSAQTESVMAGALGIQLAGDAWYFGKKHEKPTIGDALRPVEREDIARSNRLLYASSAAGLVLCLLVRFLVVLFLIFVL